MLMMKVRVSSKEGRKGGNNKVNEDGPREEVNPIGDAVH